MIIHLHDDLAVRHPEIVGGGGNRDAAPRALVTSTCSSPGSHGPQIAAHVSDGHQLIGQGAGVVPLGSGQGRADAPMLAAWHAESVNSSSTRKTLADWPHFGAMSSATSSWLEKVTAASKSVRPASDSAERSQLSSST